MRSGVKYLPALFFLLMWYSLLTDGVSIREAMEGPMASGAFITTFGRAIDNPWTHNSAIRRYFIKLAMDEAPARTWQGSLHYGWALWHQYQYAGAVEIMLNIAHLSDNVREELYWARRYAAVYPGRDWGERYLKHAKFGHAEGRPLELEGKW